MKLLFKNADIITMKDNHVEVLKNAYLGVNGSIIDYLSTEEPKEKYDVEKDMSGKLLSPGLINCHTHASMTLLRGRGSDLPLHEWLFNYMFPVEAKMTAEDIKAGTELAVLEMIRTGTTSFSDMYIFPETTIKVVGEAGLKCSVDRYMQSFSLEETYEENGRGRESIELYQKYHNSYDGRIHVDFSIHAEYTCNEMMVRKYSEDCKKLGARMHIHLSETKSEHDACKEKYGKTPAQWFNDLGTFENPTFAAHCVWVEEEDIDIFKEKNVSVVHNPSSNMKLGSGFAPIPKMIEKGINVTLGTDGAASNNNLDMFEEMHLASIIHNGYHLDPTLMKAETVFLMATKNGALLQGREDTGVLEVGKKADIIALDLIRPHLTPNFDTIALMTYAVQGSDVVMTMVDGKILYENGIYYTIDPDRVYEDVREAIKRLY